jgi:hypothetical protein
LNSKISYVNECIRKGFSKCALKIYKSDGKIETIERLIKNLGIICFADSEDLIKRSKLWLENNVYSFFSQRR